MHSMFLIHPVAQNTHTEYTTDLLWTTCLGKWSRFW